MGAIVGRFANPIGGARLSASMGKPTNWKNDGQNTNHGGFSGFDRMLWDWEILDDGVRFKRLSLDGEGGYPGNVHVTVEYRWTDDNELSILLLWNDRQGNLSESDEPCLLQFGRQKRANHRAHITHPVTYDVGHHLTVHPYGKTGKCGRHAFRFYFSQALGQDLYDDHEQLKWNKGYNHCYILKTEKSPDMVEAARLSDPTTGRSLTVKTDLPSVLLYTAGYYVYPDTAVCLETQYYPDTPSHPDFPSCCCALGRNTGKQPYSGLGRKSPNL